MCILYSMKSYKKRNKTHKKSKRGGFFFGSKPTTIAPSAECDPNNLVNIQGSDALHENYQKCCPKGFMGRKNSSPYCRQLDLNFQAALKNENDAKGYAGMSMDEAQNFEMQTRNDPAFNPPPAAKPWWKFWGGKSKKRKGKGKGTKRRR